MDDGDNWREQLSTCPITIQIAPDHMLASMILEAPLRKVSPLDPAQSLEYAELLEKRVLTQAQVDGVRWGLIPDLVAVLRGWIEKPNRNPIVLARGIPPVAGEDGRLEILFKKTQKVPGNEMNLRDLGFITNIRRGTLLARYFSATKGNPGYSIKGQELPAKDGIDKKIMTSLVETVSEKEGVVVYRAKQDGIVEKISQDQILVVDHLRISSDIDYHTGHIDAWGSLTITGSVKPNFHVKSTGDIVIQGSVESAYIEAKGSLKTDGGIFGKKESTVARAGQALEAAFVQNARVSAKGNIHVKESIVNSELSSESEVDVRGGAGAVVTSRVTAGSHVTVSTLGSTGEGLVEIRAGLNPTLWQGLERQKRELKFVQRMGLRGSYQPLDKKDKKNPLEKNIATRHIKKKQMGILLERSIRRREKRVLSDLISRKILPRVQASQKVYANVRVQIGPYLHRTTEESAGKTFQPDLEHATIVVT